MVTNEGTLIDVKKIVEDKKLNLKSRVNSLKRKGIVPKIAVILRKKGRCVANLVLRK